MTCRGWLLALTLVAGGLGATQAFAADPPGAAPAAAGAIAPPSAASAPAAVLAPSAAAARASDANERLQIADPYIELRTGPGRGFPIHYVAARGEWIEVEQRHTDWFEVRTDGGKAGWVNRSQLETTLTAAGITKSFRDVLVDDYLNRKVQLGAAWGHFKAEPMLKLWSSYRLSETLSLEGTIGQVQGVFSGTDFWHLNVLAEPWSDRRISPFFSIGVGKFTNFPNLSLVGATTTNAKLANASLGVRYYLSDRFVMRADYSLYTVFVNDAKTTEYRAWTAGLAFFF
ncbi:MAG: SH3 domain-containing protein [Caldimonas sp.]